MKKRNLTKRLGAVLLALALSVGVTALAADPFTDVKEDDSFYPAVQWGVENGITDGVSDGVFAPRGEVSRAQAVTFLWRMAGSPAPAATETFTDVPAGSWYETAVQWALEQEITNGTGVGQFSPAVTCDRAMCLTMLYRMEGSGLDEFAAAAPVEVNEDTDLEDVDLGVVLFQQIIEQIRNSGLFPDAEQNSYYELAVIWGVMGGILTEGNTGKMEEGVLFRPTDPCVRAEMISFLYQTKLMQDRANAPIEETYDNITISYPQEYYELLYRSVSGLGDDESGIFITVSEKASRDAAEALGREDVEGAGELFGIGRVTEAEAKKIAEEDVGFGEVFAKDDSGWYYVFYHPTDVRYERETPEKMTADQEQWTALNAWARTDVVKDILRLSEGLTPVDLREGH